MLCKRLVFGLLLLGVSLLVNSNAFSASKLARPHLTSLKNPSASRGPFTTTRLAFPTTSTSLSSTAASPMDDAGNSLPKETAVARMRRRKVKILHKKKTYNVGYLFGLWYVLSIAYNIISKRALNMAPELAWTAAWCQMAMGLVFVVPLWVTGVRTRPQLSKSDILRLLPVAVLHSLVHIGGVVSMGAGSVSFTYVVKASEPAVSAALSAITLKKFLPLPAYLTLIPIMGGVALSSVSELDFSWKSFNYAMLSNVASASRGIVGKKTIGKRLGKNMNAMNLYAVLTIMSSILLLPATLLLEGSIFPKVTRELFAAGKGLSYFGQLLLSAIFYYTYNEVSFLCLDNVTPVSHAIGNTVKRIAIILSSILVFRNKLTPQGIFGSIMAVGGVLLYSLAKTKYSAKKE